jgi:uncharacterized MAPEG superfamily protein
MTPSLVALCLFAGWTILLVATLALYRGLFSSRTGKALNSFSPDGTDVAGFGQRLTRAHLNCLETLPVAAAVILAAAVAGRAEVTDPLAMPLLFARLGQSIVHLISVSVPMVMLRAGLLLVQLVILGSWILRLVL